MQINRESHTTRFGCPSGDGSSGVGVLPGEDRGGGVPDRVVGPPVQPEHEQTLKLKRGH